MTQSSIAAHREGSLVAIETLVDDPDYRGVVNTTYLDADAAIRLGEALIAWGRQIKYDRVPHLVLKDMPLARVSDPHAAD